MTKNITPKAQNPIQISSAAEYLTFVASTGNAVESVEMRYEDENIWLTQKMMAALYDISIPAINQHIQQLKTDWEIDDSTIKQYLIVQQEGSCQVSRQVDHYNLQTIISIGFKIENQRAVQFRKWINQIAKDYTIKWRVMDTESMNKEEIKAENEIIIEEWRRMQNNYFIIHGSFGSPYNNWFKFVHDFIVDDKKEVYVPDFPVGVGYQNYENWSKLLHYYNDLGLINETTTIIAHSIAPVFVSKFLIQNKMKVKKLIFVCGFNNYLGINEEYDAVNESMYIDNIEEVQKYVNDIICFYSDNDPYVKYEAEQDFVEKVATEKILLKGAGHINAEAGYDAFEEIVPYL